MRGAWIFLVSLTACAAPPQMNTLTWTVDRPDEVGGFKATVLGSPKSVGGALEFDGVKDGLLLDVHPMAGWKAFTLEVEFRPDADGPTEQRFVHLQESASENRILIETRITGDGRWFLDTYIKSGASDRTLLSKEILHPAGGWHRAALVCDGKEMIDYVDGVRELSGPIDFQPPGPGVMSIGMRANRVFWFKGAIRRLRLTPRALGPSELLR